MTKTNEEKALAEISQQAHSNDLILGYNELEHLTDDERIDLFLRKSQAETSDQIDDSYLGQKLIAIAITPYVKDFIDQETGEMRESVYVAFELEDGRSFKTASIRAVPFAKDMVRFVGVDKQTGKLKFPVEFSIKPEKATTGFLYAFRALRVIKEGK